MSKFKTMDGNEAAGWVSYAFTEVAAIYPITPSSPMADLVDQWSAAGKNTLTTGPQRASRTCSATPSRSLKCSPKRAPQVHTTVLSRRGR